MRVDPIGVGVVGRAQPEIDAAVAGPRATPRASTPCGSSFQPWATMISLSALPSRSVSTISEHLALGGDEHAFAARVARRRQRHADRGDEAALVLPEALDRVLHAVAVACRRASRCRRRRPARRACRRPRYLTLLMFVRSTGNSLDREARHEHLHGRRVRDGDQRLAGLRRSRAGIGPLPP